jgi:hypothetical protein
MKPRPFVIELLYSLLWIIIAVAFFSMLYAVDGCTVRAASVQRVEMRLGVIDRTYLYGDSYAWVGTPRGEVYAFVGLIDPDVVAMRPRCLVYKHPETREWIVGQVVERGGLR